MKKFLVATITSILLLIGIVAGSIYYEKYKIEHIVKSDEAKEVIEKRLKSMDSKALTPEGKIKSYKIDYNKVKKNPMGGIYILLIINDDPEMIFDTTLEKNTVGGKYTTGAGGFSPKLYKLTNELEE
jgi:hypothetical protein